MPKVLKLHLLILAVYYLAIANIANAQHLPEGEYHENRERTIDIVHYKADLRFNLTERQVLGTATVRFHPLSGTDVLTLDAIRLDVRKAYPPNGDSISFPFTLSDRTLEIKLDREYAPDETLSVSIDYSCQPNAGLYFQPDPITKGQVFIHTYGEGGLHANWLPIYNDVNDKFSSEMIVTVPEPYTVISNGKLIESEKEADQQRRFHWRQDLPHSNYLIAIYVGEFEKGDLPPAFGEIPLSYWVPKGKLPEGAYAFRNTTKMVEFFSNRFNYRYPWDKYDQIAVPDYAIGAMEHTSVTGHRWSVLRTESAPLEFSPELQHYNDFWSSEGTISHELAHHWFGDNLTCRNLSVIWLNESFASYLQMLWDEESLGKDQLLMDRQVALDRYLEYVRKEHIIRPLEYHYFDKPNDIYNEEHTYFKGAIVLHMLRNILGDDDFFRALSAYLHKHEFTNVESQDLKIAIEEATGRNLSWFFDDWVYGGGHPVFEVSYDYVPDRKLVELNVKQVQAMVEGQGVFTLPAVVTLATKKAARNDTVWIDEATEHFLLDCGEKPEMVSFDGGGALVAEIKFPKERDELLYQIDHDLLPGQIRAVRELTRRFPTDPKTSRALANILSANDAFWGLKAEAAFQAGVLRNSEAEPVIGAALQAQDYRVRKAAVLALAHHKSEYASTILKRTIATDPQSDVVAAAIVALAKADPGAANFIRKQVGRPSWYDEITIACLDAFGLTGDASLTKEIKPYAGTKYNQHVRQAALRAWKNCAPNDPQLHASLISAAESAPYSVQQMAVAALGELHVGKATPFLEDMVKTSGDQNLTVMATEALEEIRRVEE